MTGGVTRFLLMRHAETAVPHVFHGAESDIGLSERGELQVQALAPILAAERPAAVVSSAMRRAIATAKPIADACGLTLHIETRLHERRVGLMSGQPFDDSRWPETMNHWIAGNTSFAVDGAESYDDIRVRVLPIWHRLAEQYAGRCVVIVAHGTVNKVLLTSLGAGLTHADWNAFKSLNLGVHELLHDGGRWRILRLADVSPEVQAIAVTGGLKN
jgi:broad specificity phosphatase PhoE